MLEREIRRKKIENHLSLIKAAQVKKFHFVLMKAFLSNQDFMIAADGRWEEMAEIVEEESKHKVDFSVTEIANQELIDTWNLLEKQDFENKKLKKAECISQMAAILSDDTMFEGICLAFDMEDDALQSMVLRGGIPNTGSGPGISEKKRVSENHQLLYEGCRKFVWSFTFSGDGGNSDGL